MKLCYFLLILLIGTQADCKQTVNHQFVIVVPSYNNSKWYQANLDSIFRQNYNPQDFRVIYIDDYSYDKTADLVENYKITNKLKERLTLIKNNRRRYKAANIYNAIHTCPDNAVIVICDGDDWFADQEVLNYLNDLYNKGVWLTAGGHKYHPSGYCGHTRPLPDSIIDAQAYRAYGRTTGQLRSFYAWLFKQINLEDFFYKGKFLERTSDVAKMLPMFEMAGESKRIGFNHRIVYIYNVETDLNDHKVDPRTQTESCDYILSRPSYKKLEGPVKSREASIIDAKADLFLFTSNTDTLKENPSTYSNKEELGSLTLVLSNTETPEKTFKQELITALTKSPHDYILFDKYSSQYTSYANITDHIKALERTGAYAFYFSRNASTSDLPVYEQINDTLYAWQYFYARGSWKRPHNLEKALYRKKDIVQCLQNLEFNDLPSLEQALQESNVDEYKIGLFTQN